MIPVSDHKKKTREILAKSKQTSKEAKQAVDRFTKSLLELEGLLKKCSPPTKS